MENNYILAIVGMPGSGKSEAIAYLKTKGIPSIRFGQITEDGLTAKGLPVTPENEQKFREKLRLEHGMAAYAIKAKSHIDALLVEEKLIAIDGLYSWEEYVILQKEYKNLILIALVVDSHKRHVRLGKRSVRPFSIEQAKERDMSEIEKLHKGGPIAIAQYYIENNGDDKETLYNKIDRVLQEIHAQ